MVKSITELKQIDKNDLFSKKAKFKISYESLSNNNFFKIKENNIIVKKYIDAKNRGNYRSLIYNVNEPESTLGKNLEVLRAVEANIVKPFESLTQDDIDILQVKLNEDSVYTTCNIIVKRKISHDYKLDYVKNIKQFWKFYRLYSKCELGKEIPDITEYMQIRRKKNQNKFIQFISKEEIDILVAGTNSQQMKAFLSVYYETGARVVEILKLRRGNCAYDSSKMIWTIRLPNEKGLSSTKMAIELSFSNNEFNKWMIVNKFNDNNDFIFNYSYHYILKAFHKKGKKYLGRNITPKQIRKGTTMYLINSNANEAYVRAHMGWSPNSDAISHYINQIAIKRPDQLNVAIRKDYYSEVIKENDDLKFKQKIQRDELQMMRNEMENIRKEQQNMINQMKETEISASKYLLKTLINDKIAEMAKTNTKQQS